MDIESGKIAILMATYNGEKYIEEQIESISAQTYGDCVLVIHDDGSTDGTVDIICRLRDEAEAQGRNVPIRILEGSPQGSAKGNFLWMLSQVEADYYMFADQDDVWKSHKVERTWNEYVKLHKKVPHFLCVFADMCVVDENLNVTDTSFIRSIGRDIRHTEAGQLVIDNVAAGCTMLFGRDIRDVVVSGMDEIEIGRIEMHDKLIMAVSAVLGKAAGIDEPLSFYRQHDSNEMGAVMEHFGDKVSRNLRHMFSGEIKRRHKAFVSETRGFALEVYKLCNDTGCHKKVSGALSKTDCEWLREYACMPELGYGYIKRIRFYRRHNIARAGLWSTLWMYLWM